jgi:hypothetical protein
MPALEKSLRTKLENTVKAAREVAEAGARSSLEQIGVGDADAPKHLTEQEKDLRRRLRIHGRQLGDEPGQKKGTQTIERLVEEVAYEHWHRLLFASFLAENKLLMYPDPDDPVAVTISECEDMAADEGARNGLELAARYAGTMLPQIFRIESPVFDLDLPPEIQQKLEKLVAYLPKDVFSATDSLGWVYQFWQANRKDQVNAAELKITARELSAVTQLFTEDYMVDFLLDNTLGAWYASKVLAGKQNVATTAENEDELREVLALPNCKWSYLRFIRNDEGIWGPAGGRFESWPSKATDLKCLDPCMGSGHFIVAMFERLVAIRMVEEQLDVTTAVDRVISSNIFGLEIDARCTQIAAFNLALAAWRKTGYRSLPQMNLACSGLAPNVSKLDWLSLAGSEEKLQAGMESLYHLFEKAPILGSLINPQSNGGDLLNAGFSELQPVLSQALSYENENESVHEMAVTASGLAKAAEILSDQFNLVATNVPYLGRRNQGDDLVAFSEEYCNDGRHDLATIFLQRCLDFCSSQGSIALVEPQSWLFLGAYKEFRSRILKTTQWNWVAKLGTNAFETITGEVVNVALVCISKRNPSNEKTIAGWELSAFATPSEKREMSLSADTHLTCQADQLRNPDHRFVLTGASDLPLLGRYASAVQGLMPADRNRFVRVFWEHPSVAAGWSFLQGSIERTGFVMGKHQTLDYATFEELVEEIGGRMQGMKAWRQYGIGVAPMSRLPVTLYYGEPFDGNVHVIVPRKQSDLPAIWAYTSSESFLQEIRKIDQKLGVTCATIVKIPFDLEKWKKLAAEKYPDGLPKPFSSDATQWLFNGHPAGADQSLQVAVARLVGHRWPRQTGSNLPDCPAIEADGLERQADKDGIVCIPPVRGEASAADRLLNLLAAAYGPEWNGDVLNRLLADAGYAGKSLETWLRDGFFSEHLEVFHKRPFVWHIWDGLRDGFSALVNYHKLDHKNLETLIYTYLGDWISRCESDDQAKGLGEDGEKTTAAKNLKRKLELILEGQAPYDLFVRWKPLRQQPIGWNPDINDGVRINIRPFVSVPDVKAKGAGVLRVNPKIKWDKDRGKEPERSKQDYPWFWGWDGKTTDFTGGPEFKGERFNDCHYTLDFKRQARAKAGKS